MFDDEPFVLPAQRPASPEIAESPSGTRVGVPAPTTVTIAVAVYSALAVLLSLLVGRRLTGSAMAGLLAAVTLAVAPEFWGLATIADVYTLQALLILAVFFGHQLC